MKKEEHDNVRIDCRFGKKFVSIKMIETGKAYAIKGESSNYTDQFKIIDSSVSNHFIIDSAAHFYNTLEKIEIIKDLDISNTTDGMRTEIYHNGKKVYDSYGAKGLYWKLMKPIMRSIPKGYSPFRPDDRIFE